jgi:uncharacterized SAM-binding protein YcdF (DUF218 family)
MSNLKKLSVIFIALLMLFFLGFFWFLFQINKQNESLKRSDAVVVLTGSRGRINLGLSLIKMGFGKKIFISGMHNKTSPKFMKNFWNSDVELGYKSYNTISNAKEVKEWTDQENIRSIILVTSNLHMPRSLMLFKKIVKNIDIQTHSFFPKKNSLLAKFREYLKFIATYITLNFFSEKYSVL